MSRSSPCLPPSRSGASRCGEGFLTDTVAPRDGGTPSPGPLGANRVHRCQLHDPAYVFHHRPVEAFADSEQPQLAAAYASRTSALTRPRSGTSQPFSRAQARMSAAETFAPSPAEEAADERLPLLRRPPVRRA